MTYSSKVLAAVLCTIAFTATCVAQTYTSYGTVTSSNIMASDGNWMGGNAWAVDVNNDGIPDLIQERYFPGSDTTKPAQFGVSIANGDGTFKPPVGYDVPPGLNGYGVPIAFGDFNGDGKVDLAMWGGYQTVAVYLGNGDGTFQSPWYSNFSLAQGQFVSTKSRFAVADFNHDGKPDLAIVGTCGCYSGNATVYILPGQGTGLFSNAIPVLNAPNTQSTQSDVNSLLVGDYDSDGNADLAVVIGLFDGNTGSETSYTIHVLYGSGSMAFQDTTPIQTVGSSGFSANAGDLNSDGRTDLFALTDSGLNTYYGQRNRTFTSYTQQIPGWFYFYNPQVSYPAMADFNDDGHMDVVVEAHDYTNQGFLVFLLARSAPGQFDYQTWNLKTSSTAGNYPGLAIGDFNVDQRPDWANHFFPSYEPTATGLNATAHGNWSNCPYPLTGRGISLCSPTSSASQPANFAAAAHSFGQLRKMEIWVDGTKLVEQHNTWDGNAFLNFSTSSLAFGVHRGTIYAADVDNTLQRYDFNFTIGPSNCASPVPYGLRICSPEESTTTSGDHVLVEASATISGTFARMEVWVDGVKEFTQTNSPYLSTSLNLRAGMHQFTVLAVNTAGTIWKKTVTATVP